MILKQWKTINFSWVVVRQDIFNVWSRQFLSPSVCQRWNFQHCVEECSNMNKTKFITYWFISTNSLLELPLSIQHSFAAFLDQSTINLPFGFSTASVVSSLFVPFLLNLVLQNVILSSLSPGFTVSCWKSSRQISFPTMFCTLWAQHPASLLGD